MNTAIYARVSTDEQSPYSQVIALLEAAKAKGMRVIAVFCDVANGASESRGERNELLRLLGCTFEGGKLGEWGAQNAESVQLLTVLGHEQHAAELQANFDAVCAELAEFPSRPPHITTGDWIRYHLPRVHSVFVTDTTRWTRSMQDLLTSLRVLAHNNVSLVSITGLSFRTDDATHKLILQIMTSVSEFESELRTARVRRGVKAAQAKGVKFGRKAGYRSEKRKDGHLTTIRNEIARGTPIKNIAKITGICRTTVYRIVGEYGLSTTAQLKASGAIDYQK